MQKILVIAAAMMAVLYVVTSFPDGALSIFAVLLVSIPAFYLISRSTSDRDFLANVLLVALLARLGLGFVIHYFGLESVFGPDAETYDYFAQRIVDSWTNQLAGTALFNSVKVNSGSGMFYLVASVYYVFGSSTFVAQSLNCAIGALTAPMAYFCSREIFNNRRAATYAAVCVAVFPSFVIWSSQLLKDGLIIFLLVVVMTALLKLQKRITVSTVLMLLSSIAAIFTLRFYIFYMLVVTVIGSFLLQMGGGGRALARNTAAVVLVGLGLTYFGVLGASDSDVTRLVDLKEIQYRRAALAQSAESGFAADTDVSTVSGALIAVPVGFLYLAFSPFPWEASKLSQSLVIPETFIWWSFFPLIFSGLLYTIRNKLLTAIPVLIFSTMLTIAYSVFQGNVGMAYRQRTQIQVFLFLFIGVGFALIVEKRENRKTLRRRRSRQQHLIDSNAANQGSA